MSPDEFKARTRHPTSPAGAYETFRSLDSDFDAQCALFDALRADNSHNALVFRMRADGSWDAWCARYDARAAKHAAELRAKNEGQS